MNLVKLNQFLIKHAHKQCVRKFSRQGSTGHVQYFSKLFVPTSNQTKGQLEQKKDSNQSSELLIQNGLIHCISSGHYALLPMMRIAFDKLVRIIDEEMQSIGAQKVLLPSLYSTKYLKISDRYESLKEDIFTVEDKHENSLYLAPTHEEAITSIVSHSLPLSVKRLPLLLYQLDTKFRDEFRPKFGLMRCKEFVMKDLYTFHSSEECAIRTYEQVCMAYLNIFKRLNLPVYKAQASSGAMGGSYSHEFLVVNQNGQDHMWLCDNCSISFNEELIKNNSTDSKCSKCQKQMTRSKAVEVGHTFYLGTRYSEKFKANFQTENGLKTYLMSCYGLGVTRILGVLLDECSRTDQIRWPSALAPYHVSILLPKGGSKEEKAFDAHLLAEQLSEQFIKQMNLNVLIDDRNDKTIGWKLKQHKTLGIPCSIVLGKRLTDSIPTYEFSQIDRETSEFITQSDLFDKLHTLFSLNK